MLTGDPLDTVLNLGTFAFMGFIVWLMMRKSPDDTEK